ncbi:MAG TPA: asparagine--tRNA ligase [Candidatus Krumholzibacteria bacterium]|nr:asparagine--tRNA ligase [Candidatus Krumholzibacteria bacterium]
MSKLPIVYVKDLKAHAGQAVELRGWVYNTRSGGKIRFLILRDGTGYLQCVASAADLSPEDFETLGALSQESSVIVTGTPREDKRAPGGVELTLKSVTEVQHAEGFPITPKEHSSSFLLDHRHLWLRSRKQHVVLLVRHHTIAAIRDYLNSHGFINLDTPIFTPNACEGTSTLFETDYFGDKAYLSQSGQLYNEATAAAFGKVYCFGPTFRAEKSKTRRHLTEFWMVEPEVAFMELPELMELEEDFFCYIIARVLETCGTEIREILERDTSKLEAVKKPFPRIHYKEAAKFLLEKGVPFEVGGDFGGTDETVLTESQTSPIFVHHFPTQIKAFYMEPDPKEPEYCLSVDMLAPEGYGEVIGGGQRTANLELLERRIKEHNLPRAAYEWYLDLRKYGTFPHSGFGLGVERTVSYLCGLSHLREAIPFPRMLNRLSP